MTQGQHITPSIALTIWKTYEIDLHVKGHDRIITRYWKKGTLVIQHLGKTITHSNILYYPMYSNLISGQKVREHSLEVGNSSATLKKGNNMIYQIYRDDRRGLWITTRGL